MHSRFEKIAIWFIALRGYSLPISFMSWLVPFLYGCFSGGSILYGLTALIGIITLHLATNIFDDAIDYSRGKNLIDRGLRDSFYFQNNKCAYIFNGTLNIKQYYLASLILFFISLLIAIFFIYTCGPNLLYIIIPTVILCLLYPILGCLGFGEIIVAVIFSPLLYLGVFYVMTQTFSLNIMLLSVSTGLLSVAVLHNHMLLDYNIDIKNRKTTLCNICKTQKKAFYLLFFIIICAYLNIIICIMLKKLNIIFLITFLSVPTAITLYNVMKIHINNPDAKIKPNIFMGSIKEALKLPENQQNFLIKFLIVRNLLSCFTILICIAIVLSRIF